MRRQSQMVHEASPHAAAHAAYAAEYRALGATDSDAALLASLEVRTDRDGDALIALYETLVEHGA